MSHSHWEPWKAKRRGGTGLCFNKILRVDWRGQGWSLETREAERGLDRIGDHGKGGRRATTEVKWAESFELGAGRD